MLNINQIYNEDCLSGMKKLSDGSIDFIFSDLPYGITNNSWDIPIPLDTMWKEFERIIKDNGCIALWSQSPFDKTLSCSNLQLYRYEWIIEKTKATGHLNAKKMPMKAHENVLIFYKKLPVYHPQMTDGHSPVHSYAKHTTDGSNYGKNKDWNFRRRQHTKISQRCPEIFLGYTKEQNPQYTEADCSM